MGQLRRAALAVGRLARRGPVPRAGRGRGRRLRLREHELRVNPALVAHFEREFELELGDEGYRIESAGIEAALEDIRGAMAPLNGLVDDRIGLISEEQHEAMLAGSLDVTPGVLIVDGPRDGVLAGLAGAEPGCRSCRRGGACWACPCLPGGRRRRW